MKKFMTPNELARDDRFTRSEVPLDFLMAEEVTVEQVEETMMNLLANDEVRAMIEDQTADSGAPNLLKRVRPDEEDAPVFIKTQMHGIFMGEMQALEAAGRSAWDFTDDDELPWKFQLDMARQCWDETRHVEIYSALLDHVDGRIGEFNENLFLFEFGCSDDPAERVVGVNRCLEGLALDVFNDTMRFAKQADDDTIWQTVDYVSADEVTHVRFGQVWSKLLTEGDPERRKKVVAFQRKVDRAFSLGGLRGSYDGANAEKFLPLAVEFRKLAGFSDSDIAEVAGAGPKVVGAK
jgi:uncharacterized ferritin-like protein (DUF455 family)